MAPLQLVAAIGGLSFVLCSLVTGARLLFVARRTRQLPELACGFGLFLMGGLGYPMTLLGEHGTFLSDVARGALVAGNNFSAVLGLTGFAFFTWRVFRPESTLGRAAVWAFAILFTSSFGYRLATTGFAPIALDGSPQTPLHAVLTVAVLAWAGTESLYYHGRLRKRMLLGLSDPILVQRMWMWAQGMFAAGILSGISSFAIMLDVPFNQTAWGMLTIGCLGTVAAGSIWLAFFPPDRYAAWVRNRWEARARAATAPDF